MLNAGKNRQLEYGENEREKAPIIVLLQNFRILFQPLWDFYTIMLYKIFLWRGIFSIKKFDNSSYHLK